MTTPLVRPKLRLWIVSLVLFAGGFVGSRILNSQGDVGSSYPVAVVVQVIAYGAGLVAWATWWELQAQGGKQASFGCLAGMALTVASILAVISSIPK